MDEKILHKTAKYLQENLYLHKRISINGKLKYTIIMKQ